MNCSTSRSAAAPCHGAAVEELDALDVWRADEAAIQRVGPAVILAAQNIFAAAAERDRPGAMAANVAKSAQRSLLIADDDDWLAGNVGGEKTFGVGDGCASRHSLPRRIG